MSVRKSPEEKIAQANAEIAKARLKIARQKSETVRLIEAAIGALGALPETPPGVDCEEAVDAQAALEAWLSFEVQKANGGAS